MKNCIEILSREEPEEALCGQGEYLIYVKERYGTAEQTM